MNKRNKYTPVEKANILLETLRKGKNLAEIAHKYDVSQQLISRWSKFLANMPSVFDKKASETEKLKQELEAEKTASQTLFGGDGRLCFLSWSKYQQEGQTVENLPLPSQKSGDQSAQPSLVHRLFR